MKSRLYLGMLLWGLIGLACGRAPSSDPTEVLRADLRQRYAQGDTLPMTPLSLKSLFPAGWQRWQPVGTLRHRATLGPQPFLTVEQPYRQSDGWTYLGISLSDYVADSTALLRLRQSWPEVTYLRALPHPRIEANASTLRQLPATGATRLELICQARYLISLQTNHPEGERMLIQALQRMRWEVLARD